MGWVAPGSEPGWIGMSAGPHPMTDQPGEQHGQPMRPQNADEENNSLEGSENGVPKYSTGSAGEVGEGVGEGIDEIAEGFI